MKKWYVGCLIAIGITLVALVVLSCVGTSFFATNGRYRVDGNSTLPTLHDGDLVFVDKSAYAAHLLQRGDLVLFYRDANRTFIKRVVGLPGETIEIRQGQVFINGQAIRESYLKEPIAYSQEPRAIGRDEYFVLGDNRNNSSDSHNWGNVPFKAIGGKAWFIYWPLERLGIIPSPQYAP